MANQDNPQGAAGGVTPPAGNGDPATGGKGTEGKPDGTPNADANRYVTPNADANRYVTPEILKGVLDQKGKTYKADLADLENRLSTKLSETMAQLLAKSEERNKAAAPPGEKDKGAKPEVPDQIQVELNNLKRSLDEEKKKAEDYRTSYEAAKKEREEEGIQARVTEALRKYDCQHPDAVAKIARPELLLSDDKKSIVAHVKDKWDNESVISLDDWVKDHFREKFPAFFKGANRAGSPAGGDNGAPRSRITQDKLKEPGYYQQNLKEIEAAYDRGEIKNSR